MRLLGKVSYDEVVEVEQELIREGLPTAEILELCDVHTEALQGVLDPGEEKDVPEGHPVAVFRQENQALRWEITEAEKIYAALGDLGPDDDPQPLLHDARPFE